MSLGFGPFIVETITYALHKKVPSFKGGQEDARVAARTIYEHLRLNGVKLVLEAQSPYPPPPADYKISR